MCCKMPYVHAYLTNCRLIYIEFHYFVAVITDNHMSMSETPTGKFVCVCQYHINTFSKTQIAFCQISRHFRFKNSSNEMQIKFLIYF